MDLTERLESCYTGAVYDVMREMGRLNCVLPSSITPVDPDRVLAGPVWTCSGRIDESITNDESMLAWTGMLSKAPAGSVVVCQPNDSTVAHMGELSAETLKLRRVRGFIVDGGCRDVDFILKLQYPVFCRYYTPADVVGRWIVEGFGEPVTIGEVAVSTDDYALADRDGVIIIPAGIAEQVVSRTEEIINTENRLRTSILSGMDPQEAYRRYRLF